MMLQPPSGFHGATASTNLLTVPTVPDAQRANSEVRMGARFGPEEDPYEVGEELGHGAASRVFACRRLRTDEQLAVKVVNLQRLQLLGDLDGHLKRLDREVQILRELHHQRIVNLFDFHRTERWYFLVMERVLGGELFNEIVSKKSLTEVAARYVFRQLLEGIGYMHSMNVIHRDLKPENILIVRSITAPSPLEGVFHDVKIADFGLSKVISEGTSLAKTCVGTPQYWAPEVLNTQRNGGSYGQAADLWGLGAVLFVMLCGKYPFNGKKMPMEEQIRTATFDMGTARWRGISEDAKDLVRGLLRVSPAERLTLESCLSHPWVLDTGLAERLPEDSRFDRQLSAEQEERPPSPPPRRLDAERVRDVARYGSPDDGSPDSREEVCASRPAAYDCSRVSRAAPPTPVWRPPPPREARLPSSDEFSGASVSSRSTNRRRWIACAVALLFSIFSIFCVWFSAGSIRGAKPVTPSMSVWKPNNSLVPVPEVKQPPIEKSDVGRHTDHVVTTESCITTPSATADSINGLPQKAHHWIPLLGDGDNKGSDDSCTDQETIFRLSELLKLQVSIVGSLQMAVLAFRHADTELAEATRATFRQARDLFQQAANVVTRYGQVAQQVRTSVLPVLKLAVEEQEPSLAVDLLDAVKSWVTDMKRDGEVMRLRYTELQESVLDLSRRAQSTKTDADQRLAEAVQAVQEETGAESTPREAEQAHDSETHAPAHGHDLSAERFALEPHGAHSLLSQDSTSPVAGPLQTAGVAACESAGIQAVASSSAAEAPQATAAAGSLPAGIPAGLLAGLEAGTTAAATGGVAGGVVGYQHSLNGLTQQLFEQLERLGTGSALVSTGLKGVDVPMISNTGDVPMISNAASGEDEARKRNVIDLLFMAPGIAPSSLPMLETVNFTTDSGTHSEDGGKTERSASSWFHYLPDPRAAASRASRSSASLLRALRELRRVDAILSGCSAFWANMDGTVDKLARMKDMTERLVGFATSSARLRTRFEQQLGEYANFWASLEKLCGQYSVDHHTASSRMQDFVREVADAADLIDTAESARAGLVAGKREKTRRAGMESDNAYAVAERPS